MPDDSHAHDALDALYDTGASKIAGCPERGQVPLNYLAHFGKPFRDGITWDEFTAEIDREAAHLASQANPALPIYNDEERKGWSAFTYPDEGANRATLTTLCAGTAVALGSSTAVSAVLGRMLDRLSSWYTLPKAGVEEKNAEFSFYRLRCLLSGAGHGEWRSLAGRVVSQVGECPFDPDEDEDTWNKRLIEAHRACGWPTTLLWLDWASVPDFDGDLAYCEWLKPLALAHILKHMRRAQAGLHMAYHGHVEYASMKSLNSQQRAMGTPFFWQKYARALGKPSTGKSAKATALESVMANLGPDDLLPAIPVSDVPGEILAGPWSTLLPAYNEPTAFCQPGTRLAGVWRASGGRVVPYEGDGDDCLDIAWNTTSAASDDHIRARTMFSTALPDKYPVIRPSELLLRVYPHWLLPDPKTNPKDFAGYCALVDAVFCAAVLRHGHGARVDLLREFPLICVLPAKPTADDSTNQGKGLLCQSIAGAFAPGIPLLAAPDSTSAPDARAVAEELRHWGTLALDEFAVPSSKAHCLSRDNLQALCTATQIASGKAFENGGKVMLRHSLVIAAKWLDLSPDLRNRSLPLFLNDLPEDQRARVEIKEMLESGQFSLLLRLAAVSLVDAARLRDIGRPTAKISRRAWRFTTHRFLAVRLFRTTAIGSTMTDDEAYDVIDEVRASLDDDLERHQQYADESGISASTSAGVNIRLSWSAFWAGLDDQSMALIVGQISQSGEQRHEGGRSVTVSALCRMRLEAMGIPGGGFSRLLPALTGQEARVTNTAIVRSLSLSMRAFYADPIGKREHAWLPLPGDLGNNWEACVVPRAWDSDLPSGRTLMVSIRMKGTKQ